MSVRAQRLVFVLAYAALLLASGCDQVGAPLVDQRRGAVPLPFTRCPAMVDCELPDAGPLLPPLPADEVDVRACGGRALGDPEPCDPTPPDGGSESGDVTADAGTTSDAALPTDPEPESGQAGEAAPDDLSAAPDGPLLPPCEPIGHEPIPAQLDCVDLSSRDAPLQDSGEQLARAQWLHSNVRIESRVPRTIAIEELTASDVWIELRGPVTLRIGARDAALFTFGSGPPVKGEEPIENLRVSGVATEAGAPQLLFEGVRARTVRIGDETRAFAGRVMLRSSELLSVQLLADEVVLESSRLEEGTLHTRLLTAGDAVLTGLGMELERALLARSELRKSQLTRCGDVALVATSAVGSLLSACDTPLRLIGARMIEGALDGAVEADSTNFEAVVFGMREPTELVLWSGRITKSGLCGGVERMTLAELSGVECTQCESDTFVPDATCKLPAADLFLKNNLCPGFAEDAIVRCPLPYPPRHRADPRF